MKKCDNLAFQGDISLMKMSVLGITSVTQLIEMGCKKVTQKINSAEREAYGYHPEKGLVLAQGESRNHFHAFRDTENVEMYELAPKAANDNKRLFVVINKPIPLVHEEHDPIEFQPDIYELAFQYEYTFEDEYRRVAD